MTPRVANSLAVVPFFDVGPLDLAAGESSGIFDDGLEDVSVVGIAGQRPGVQHELTRARALVLTTETLTPIYGPRPHCKSDSTKC